MDPVVSVIEPAAIEPKHLEKNVHVRIRATLTRDTCLCRRPQ